MTQLLLATQKTPSFFLIAALCVLVGVIAVPITEEFVFRLLFQGAVTRFFPGRHGLSPLPVILIPAAAFAMIHARKTTPLSPESLHELVTHMMILPVAYGGVLLLGIGWLRLTCRATAAQLGWNPRRFFADLARGGFVFLLFLPLMITLQLGLGRLFPEHVTDPIPIFFLAIYLGLLTYRTGRITPAIGLHMALNLFSFNLIMCRILL